MKCDPVPPNLLRDNRGEFEAFLGEDLDSYVKVG